MKDLEVDCLKKETAVIAELRKQDEQTHRTFVDSLEYIINRKNIPTFASQSFAGEFYNYLKQKVQCPEAVFTLAVSNTDYFRNQKFRMTNNPFPMLNVTISSWIEGVQHFTAWQELKAEELDCTSTDNFFSSLERAGYIDKGTVKKLQRLHSKLFRSLSEEENLLSLKRKIEYL